MQNKNMKLNRYFLMLATATVLALPSCKEDEVEYIEDDQVNTNPERLFMPMFRQQTTTNKSVDVDAYACDIASKCPYSTSTHVNDIQLYWYGVNGASGYRIDLAVRRKDGDGYLLAIECDGPSYAAQRTARDRDELRASVLKSLGWHVTRLWSVDWALDRKRAEESLLGLLDALNATR